jgi:hypothetical protein
MKIEIGFEIANLAGSHVVESVPAPHRYGRTLFLEYGDGIWPLGENEIEIEIKILMRRCGFFCYLMRRSSWTPLGSGGLLSCKVMFSSMQDVLAPCLRGHTDKEGGQVTTPMEGLLLDNQKLSRGELSVSFGKE